MRPLHIYVVGALLLLLAAASASAQTVPVGQVGKGAPKPGRYIPLDFRSQDAEALVREQLQNLESMEQARKIAEQVMRNFNKQGINPDLFKNLDLQDPEIRKRLEDVARQQANSKTPPSKEQLEKLASDLKKIATQQLPPVAPNVVPPALPNVEKPEFGPLPPPAAEEKEQKARDWLKEVMEQTQDTEFGQWLRESPAWQQAFEDLQTSLRKPPAVAPGGWGLDKLAERLGGFGRLDRLPLDRLPVPDGKLLERLGNIKPPTLPRWAPSLPSLSRPNLPTVPPPSVPHMSGLGRLATWLLCVGLAALLLWQAARLLKPAARAARDAAADLGPWPVDPKLVATRAELVRAFDYLALVTLGLKARSWHHRAVASALGQRSAACIDAASQLAALYEQARYTEGPAALAEAERDRARRALGQIIEAVPA